MLKKILFASLLISLIPFISRSQAKDEVPRFVKTIYDNIFSSMSNGFLLKPNLVYVKDLNYPISKKIVAEYSPVNRTISIGNSFINLSKSFGADSTNVIAHVLSHELAHLFLNHGYTSVVGTGFASAEINKEFRKIKQGYEENMGEMEADQWAFFYSNIAGYKTEKIVPKLLDSIYADYKLTDSLLSKYPKLSERKAYANKAFTKMSAMNEAFDFANLCLLHGDFDLAIQIYSAITVEGFKSREIISNLGSAYLLKALDLIDTSQLKFILPVQIDFYSRLNRSQFRTLVGDDVVNELLQNAIDCYKNAVNIDAKYGIGYFNLAISYWLLGEKVDVDYFLKKTKSVGGVDLDNIKLFECIVALTEVDKERYQEGKRILIELNNEGFLLGKLNYSLLENKNVSENNFVPSFIPKLNSVPLNRDFTYARNVLDTIFKKDKFQNLTCKEVNDEIISRKWKYYSGRAFSTLQYKLPFKVVNSLSREDLECINTIPPTYKDLNWKIWRFIDYFIILDNNNQYSIQILKKS